MKLLRRKERPSLDSRLAALLEAAELGEGRLPAEAVTAARAVAERAGARRRLSVEHTVAALAGATGSGKSSLFNAMTGTDLAAVGVTRPTTSTAQAALWDGAGAGALLDWLDVPHRHSASAVDNLSGLVLLDLPDHDSIRLSHRLEVDRLVELVDLLVWVLDPQKYADAAIHERYLRPLAGHRDVMVVVLNQIDRLPPGAADRCLKDLRRLLDADGLTGVPVLGVSARTGAGLAELRTLLSTRVADRASWSARLAADVTTAATHLTTASSALPRTSGHTSGGPRGRTEGSAGEGTLALDTGPAHGAVPPDAPHHQDETGSWAGIEARGGGGPLRSAPDGQAALPAVSGDITGLEGRLVAALSRAAGVPVVVEAVAKGHRHRAVVATGWPVTRWVRRFRPDPLRRLRIGVAAPASSPDRELVGRTSVPEASAVQRAQVETAIRDVGESAAAGLPGAWAASVRQAARSRSAELADAVDKAVGRTSLGATRRPRWWRAVNALQWLVFAALLAGALWLGGLFALGYLRLPEPPLPTAGEVPWPTVLLLGGALAGVLIALLSRVAAWLGGRRRARKASKALREAIGRVGQEYVLQPVEEERDRYTRFADAVTRAG
ncbi:YfjP family GTPase [Nonomuraea harbinensis]|uniref:YfjP family GTPase n=1 Tax=Nonomuraea harbinensis TaxID=1286938 RepID=A0ABW1BY93_9ACTN|nr:YfjP family GTPase [Nonomuraea harbinensis]